jgi:hypothetical protein
MAEVRGTETLIGKPHPEKWHAVLGSLITTVLPFEHPAFPNVSPAALLAETRRVFRLDEDESFAFLPQALMLFDDASLFDSPLAPIIDDERRSIIMSRVSESNISGAIEQAITHDQDAWKRFANEHGEARFLEQSLEARKAYLALWANSSFITRRRFYRGVKALVTITAYSEKSFWKVVGFEGPLLQRG